MNWPTRIGLVLSLLLHFFDQATDIFAAILFYHEGHLTTAIITLGIVFLPGFCIFIAELKRTFCSKPCSLIKSTCYLLFSPLWAIVLHLYSFYDERYIKTALFFKTLEGFVEAGPQLALQLSLLFKGHWSQSSQMVLDPIKERIREEEDFITTTLAPSVETTSYYVETTTTDTSLVLFDRVYSEDARYFFGCVHVFSVFLSFISIWSSSVAFNDLEDVQPLERPGGKSCPRRQTGKLIFGAPFFLFTLVFRALGLALLICFLQVWSGVIIFSLFFINVLTAMIVGDDFLRSCTFALWSLLVPVGYSRDPSSYLGYRKVPLIVSDVDEVLDQDNSENDNNQENQPMPPTDQEIERSGARAKYFLTMHVLCSVFVLGTSLIIMIALVFTHTEDMSARVNFPLNLLSYLFLPILGLSLGLSVLLVRPYYRCDCSGGEPPKGNIIV